MGLPLERYVMESRDSEILESSRKERNRKHRERYACNESRRADRNLRRRNAYATMDPAKKRKMLDDILKWPTLYFWTNQLEQDSPMTKHEKLTCVMIHYLHNLLIVSSEGGSRTTRNSLATHCTLQGYVEGNPVTDQYVDPNNIVMYAHRMGLLSDNLYQGAGHTAPEYKPQQCQSMIQRWLSNYPL